MIEKLCFWTSQAKATFVPPQNNSGEISLSFFVSATSFFLLSSNNENQKILNQIHLWLNHIDLFAAGMDLTAYITTNYVQIHSRGNE